MRESEYKKADRLRKLYEGRIDQIHTKVFHDKGTGLATEKLARVLKVLPYESVFGENDDSLLSPDSLTFRFHSGSFFHGKACSWMRRLRYSHFCAYHQAAAMMKTTIPGLADVLRRETRKWNSSLHVAQARTGRVASCCWPCAWHLRLWQAIPEACRNCQTHEHRLPVRMRRLYSMSSGSWSASPMARYRADRGVYL